MAKVKAYKVKTDKNKCTYCGSCAQICPDIFEINADGSSRAKVEYTSNKDVLKAEEACPCVSVSFEEVDEDEIEKPKDS